MVVIPLSLSSSLHRVIHCHLSRLGWFAIISMLYLVVWQLKEFFQIHSSAYLQPEFSVMEAERVDRGELLTVDHGTSELLIQFCCHMVDAWGMYDALRHVHYDVTELNWRGLVFDELTSWQARRAHWSLVDTYMNIHKFIICRPPMPLDGAYCNALLFVRWSVL